MDSRLSFIYDFNVDGLEQQWRVWLGAEARPIPPTPTPLSAAAIPTVIPLAGPETVPTPAVVADIPADPTSPAPATGFCGLGLAPLMLIGAFAWRKKKGA